MENLLCIVIIYVSLARVQAKISSSYWQQDSSADVLSLTLISTSDLQSTEDCLVHCANEDGCQSIIYNQENKTCNKYSTKDSDATVTIKSSEKFYYLNNASNCNESGYVYQATHNLCYRVHLDKRSYNDAELNCQSEGGHLFIIDTVAKMDYFTTTIIKSIQGKVEDNSFIYLGGHFVKNESRWTWLDGQSVSLSNYFWSHGEPNYLPNEECMTAFARSGKWNDYSCTPKIPYVCTKNDF